MIYKFLGEIWKDIEGFEGLYQVSNLGRVKSLGNGNSGNSKERILKARKDKYGYLLVHLYKDGKEKHFTVHRLVAKVFIPNPHNLPQVNHKDENKQNNFVWVNEDGSVDFEKSNLEWCDGKYNINYGSHNQRSAEKHCKPVIATVITTGEKECYPSTCEAGRKLHYGISHICDALNGRRKTACERTWQYVEK